MNIFKKALEGIKKLGRVKIPARELAKIIGISVVTLRKMANNGDIPCQRFPGSEVQNFFLDEIEEWLEKQGKKK